MPAWLLLAALASAAVVPEKQVFFQRRGAVMALNLANGWLRELTRGGTSWSVGPLALTPDGRRVYYSQDGNLWSVPTSGGAAVRVTRLGRVRPTGDEGSVDECDLPLLSPDGIWLAYRFAPRQGTPQLRCCLADGSRDRLLSSGPELGPGAWSPDSRRLVYEFDGRLWWLPPQGGQPTVLTAPEGGRRDAQPSFANDGRLAFTRDLTPLILRSDGTLSRPGPDGLTGQFPSFSPDGRYLSLVDQVSVRGGHQYQRPLAVDLTSGECLELARTEPGGTAWAVGWLGPHRLLLVRGMAQGRKLYALDVPERRATLLWKATLEDDGFTIWP